MSGDYATYCRPRLATFLHGVGLDATYERAEGDWLWRRDGDRLTRVLDLLGGFGANLFGHYHPDLVAEDRRITDARLPLLAQGSIRRGAGELAKALNARTGDYLVIFTNSGTETVEAALKHAALETGRKTFCAVVGSFHGKTLGSIQLTYSFRGPYAGLGPAVHFLDPADPASWDAITPDLRQVAGIVVEPVLGEGGVRPLPPAFVAWVNDVCARENIPLIVDEVQTGMGRSGTFLASESIGLRPDYICLSKSLGGGLAKIGALLIRRDRFVADFALRHTSTFAEDDRSCLLGLKALEILDRDGLTRLCGLKGERWRQRLDAVRAKYPDVIADVRGTGLMIGVELRDQSESPSNVFRMLSCQEYFGYMIASYLLNVHQIRLAPTLTDPWTLRIEPSAYIGDEALEVFVAAMEQMCTAVSCLDVVHLIAHLSGHEATAPTPFIPRASSRREPARTARRVAFIGHLLDPADAVLWDPRLTALPPSHLHRFMERPSRVLGPTAFDQLHVESATGEIVHLTYIGLDLTPHQIWTGLRTKDIGWIREKILDGIDMAREEGCRVVGLGGYTSMVLTRAPQPTPYATSGNALTVGMGAAAIARAMEARGLDLGAATMGIVGAAGSIGSAYAAEMASRVAQLILIVRDTTTPRARATLEGLQRRAPHGRVTMTSDLNALQRCQVLMAASNSPEPLIYPEHLSDEIAVICDVSLPGDVAASVRDARPEVPVIQGGIVRLPRSPDFLIAGLPLPPGDVYACLAETLLIGLEDGGWRGQLGSLTPADVASAMALAEKHGFALADPKTEGERSTPVRLVGGLADLFTETYGRTDRPRRES